MFMTREDALTQFVFEFLGPTKAAIWWATPNPQLGNIAPAHMIAIGKKERLFDWIELQMCANAES